MILYFSGTGNSAYVAKRIGKEIEGDVVDLFEKLRSCDFSEMHSKDPWVIVAPTYGWRVPRLLHEWLENTNLSGSKKIYFVMTCGGNIGNSGKYLSQLCNSKKMNYSGCYPIVMPENYIAMFSTPAREEALQTIDQAEAEINKAAHFIRDNKVFPELPLTIKDRINSGIVNDVFYPVFVHAKKFYAKDSCTSCGKCADFCPLNNIQLETGKPVWGKACTHCMACICRCPVEAIEYGKHSKGLPRYVCPR